MRKLVLVSFALFFGCSSADDGGAAPEGETSGEDSALDDTSTPLLDASMDESAPPPGDSASDTSMMVDAGPPAVRLVGRFTTDNQFAWSASQMIAKFNGTAARVKLGGSSNEQFQVLVDGKPTEVLKLAGGAMTYTVASGLTSGVHTVTLWRRTESFFGVTTYGGFEFDGMLLPPDPAPTRKLEIVGDSITCGYGDEGMGPSCPFTADTENNSLAYGAIAARGLGADLVETCWSGIGMYRDYGGGMTDQMPIRYERTLPNSTSSTWDFSKYVPSAVVINLGTNDFAKGDPGMPYQTAYLAFVRKVRMHYPSAYILAIIPVDGAKKYIDAVVSTLSGEGDKKVGSMQFAPYDATADGWGCDYHPSVAAHAKMGKQLQDTLKSKLGW